MCRVGPIWPMADKVEPLVILLQRDTSRRLKLPGLQVFFLVFEKWEFLSPAQNEKGEIFGKFLGKF